jgi:putative transposase
MYSFIAEEKAGSRSVWSVSEMCRTLGVSRQGFYDWESRAPSDRELDDRMLAVEIKAIWESGWAMADSVERSGQARMISSLRAQAAR